jgi:hypothetical protein
MSDKTGRDYRNNAWKLIVKSKRTRKRGTSFDNINAGALEASFVSASMLHLLQSHECFSEIA